MTLSWIGDDDKIDLANRVKGVIEAHEAANLSAALVDAGCQYGQRRQDGQLHEHAAQEVEGVVYGWYGLTPPAPPFVELPRVTVAGQFFQVNGQPWTMIEASDFNLLGRFVAGENIEPILEQRATTGFNTLRVFTAYDIAGIGVLKPSPQLYTLLVNFLHLCAQYGLYVELVAFTGPYQTVFLNDAAKVDHWESLITACTGETNVFLERANELDNSPNTNIPLNQLRWPSGILCSAGSNSADHAPVLPVWDYASYHSNDLNEWWRKTGHNSMEQADLHYVPVTGNENTRFPDKDSNSNHAYDAALAAALLCAGSCYHSVRGKTSELWADQELVCAIGWVAGAMGVDLQFQAGVYHHRTDLETSGVLRAYDRQLPDGRVFVVKIRA